MAIVEAQSFGTMHLPSRFASLEVITSAIRRLASGHSNSLGLFVLNETPTTVLDSRVSQRSVVLFINSSQQMARDYLIWLTAVRDGEFDMAFSRTGSPGPVNIFYAIIG